MNIGITRRVVRLAFLLAIGTLAVVGYTLVGILTVLAHDGMIPTWLATLFMMPILLGASGLAAFYLTHTGSPAWREASGGS